MAALSSRLNHEQDACPTAGEDKVVLIFPSATLRLCVTLLFACSLPQLCLRPRLRHYLASDDSVDKFNLGEQAVGALAPVRNLSKEELEKCRVVHL